MLLLGLFGAALFYGDGVITPAISVLSAVEGLEVMTPIFKPWILPITLGVLREGSAMELSGVRAGAPPMPGEMKRYRDFDFEFSVRDVAYLDREQMQLEADQGGVLVTMVQNGGWTSLAGLQSNDVLMAIDGQSIANEKDVETKLEAIKQTKPKAVIFKVRRGIHTQFIEVEPIWSEAAE